MKHLSNVLRVRVVNDIDDLSPADVATADLLEIRRLEADNWLFIEGCANPKTVTILLRGNSITTVDEEERAVHDAIMVAKDVMETPWLVGGGGSTEAELAHRIRGWARTIPDRRQFAIAKFADALESIPLTLAENAGMNYMDALGELRSAHGNGLIWAGIDATRRRVVDMQKEGIMDPLIVKTKLIKIATELAINVLRVDDIIAAPPPGRWEQRNSMIPGQGVPAGG
jgi:chaperonin GroEL (HSP60 family)